MSRDRGLRLQNALALYLRQWWPGAESAGAGRKGSDILGTPGIVWENKTSGKGDRNIGAWIDQAASHKRLLPSWNPADLSVVVYWPPGLGEQRPGQAIAMLPLADLITLMQVSAAYLGMEA